MFYKHAAQASESVMNRIHARLVLVTGDKFALVDLLL